VKPRAIIGWAEWGMACPPSVVEEKTALECTLQGSTVRLGVLRLREACADESRSSAVSSSPREPRQAITEFAQPWRLNARAQLAGKVRKPLSSGVQTSQHARPAQCRAGKRAGTPAEWALT